MLFMLLSAFNSFSQKEEKALVDSIVSIVNPKKVTIKIDTVASNMSDGFVGATNEPDLFMIQYKGQRVPKGLILTYVKNWASGKVTDCKFSLLADIDKNYLSVMIY